MAESTTNIHTDDDFAWYVMRDLKPKHAKNHAYDMLKSLNVTCYTPIEYQLVVVGGEKVVHQVLVMPDLLFVKSNRNYLDALIKKIPKLQYRYKLGVQSTPIVVRPVDMDDFIRAVENSNKTKFYAPHEVTPEMTDRKIRIIGGHLDGYTGTLITTRGSKKRRLLLEIPNLVAASVEVEAEYIQIID